MEVLRYVAGMELQLGAMVDELQGVREQLAEMQKNQPKAVTEKLLDKVSQLQEKISSLSERLTAIKDHLIDTATQAVIAFKEKGTKEVSDEKMGIGLTRTMNTPIKKNIAAFRKQIDWIDKAMEKLDKVSARLHTEKEVEKGARVSVKEKMLQMKAKSKEECL